jgi:RNA polymerase sigma-70 factor (ECF subfamily)
VRNRSRNYVRDGKRRSADQVEQARLVSTSPSPDRMAEIAEIRNRLLSALRELSEERRQVVLLHDLEGWTHSDIAQRMGLPVGTVASHLHHARKRLRETLRDREEDE